MASPHQQTITLHRRPQHPSPLHNHSTQSHLSLPIQRKKEKSSAQKSLNNDRGAALASSKASIQKHSKQGKSKRLDLWGSAAGRGRAPTRHLISEATVRHFLRGGKVSSQMADNPMTPLVPAGLGSLASKPPQRPVEEEGGAEGKQTVICVL